MDDPQKKPNMKKNLNRKNKPSESKEKFIIEIPLGRRMTEEEWRSLPSPEKLFRNFRKQETVNREQIQKFADIEPEDIS